MNGPNNKVWFKNNLFYKIVCGDSVKYLSLFTNMDLIIGSPPYADLRGYDCVKPDEYVKWFHNFIKPIYSSLQKNGVFVLNINSRVVKGVKHIYPYEVVQDIVSNGFYFIDNIIWNKGKLLVHANSKRPAGVYENCFVFTKGLNYIWNAGPVRTEYNPISVTRMKYKIPKRYSRYNNDSVENKKDWNPNPLGAYPKNILNIGSESRRVSDIHTSVFPVTLVDWFIKAFTNKGCKILDPWSGSGTSIISAFNNKRGGYGIEKNYDFYLDSINRIEKAVGS